MRKTPEPIILMDLTWIGAIGLLFDIVLVLYNNADWLRKCVAALAGSKYDHTRLNLILVDNAPSEEMLGVCLDLQRIYPVFGGFQYVPSKKNKGFGNACNQGVLAGEAPYLFFLNVDTEIEPDCFTEIEKAIAKYPEAGGFECRQLPYELGHHINPVTLETPWASGASFIVEREIFYAVGGFDDHIFMYCEDIDLSWRIRAAGYQLIYLPAAIVNHYVLNRQENIAADLREYTGTVFGRLLLAYKYGGAAAIYNENRRYLHTMKTPRHFPGVRRMLAKMYAKSFLKLWPFLFWRFRRGDLFKAAPACFEENFAPERGREVLNKRIKDGPRFSVVVRTCGRPDVLRGALTSLVHQTYSNFEVVVVEDGSATSMAMVEEEFSSLDLRYFSTGKNVGRGRAGNLGLEQAQGDYLNFLDDDDYLYPDHLEMMAARALSYPEADVILGCAMVMMIEVKSRKPYSYVVEKIEPMRFDRLDLFTMSQTCQIPIQSACFRRSLYEKCGGLDERIEGNEDWAMWMHFLAVAQRIDPKHIDIHRATSIFLLPANDKEQSARLEKYKVYDEAFFSDPSLRFEVTLNDMRGYYDDIIGDIQHLEQKGMLKEWLEKESERGK